MFLKSWKCDSAANQGWTDSAGLAAGLSGSLNHLFHWTSHHILFEMAGPNRILQDMAKQYQ